MSLTMLTPEQRAVLTADYLARNNPGRLGYEIEYCSDASLALWHWVRATPSDPKLRHGEPIHFVQGTFRHLDGDLVDELTRTYNALDQLLLEEQAVADAPVVV